ncbi:phenylalanine--tRNA ligase subunit alpha [Desertibaculum subflavum]|uniref:phenylalanine--tRNA ligase subunit alpha n=1 Tax=Desertibaculum subflavum TaxID=2268458 RepID=UPI000E66BC4D
MQDVTKLETELLARIEAAATLDALEAERVGALGRKGRITELMKGLGGMEAEARKSFAAELNRTKDRVADALATRKEALAAKALDARLAGERIDITLPPAPEPQGRIHPVSQVIDEITEIFAAMGFTIAEGPDIEDDFHNFTALNIPPDHPARQMHDTFYLPEKPDGSRLLLRTHTSPVQIRSMQAGPPPHRIVVPGRTYRIDSDATHTPMFHQIEGLVIDRDIHMGHLKGTLAEFCRAFFEVERVNMRFRPSYFPFTEPSAEVDIGCDRSGGQIRIGEGSDWLEILGCGMVHPKVLEAVGIDPNEWQGFAWGMGIDRIAMLKYGIPDLRAFFDSDLRWLRHYGFQALDLPRLGEGLSR